MLRHLVKVCYNTAVHDSLASYRFFRHGQHLHNVRAFSSEMQANWPEAIKTFLSTEKIQKPTLIQERTLPIAMESKDLVGIARTGSGKTLAFVVPAVMKILKERESSNEPANTKQGKRPTCLIMAPTRELASQTADVFKKFRNFGIRSIVLVGGSSRSAQLRDLEFRDHDVYIATPGRLLDLADSGVVDLSNIKYLVLDEADRMLDMGFEPQIRSVVEKIPRDRQTLMWSATWPSEIQSLAQEFMNNYELVSVDSEKLKANPNIVQQVEFCEPHRKLSILIDHLQKMNQENASRTLIFVNTKRMAEQLLLQLMRNRYRAVSLHGDRSQQQRDEALRLFKERRCNIMVATDVAARGLDIDDITHVINYDFPKTIEDYIHRIGRTARHDKEGTAISFFTDNDTNLASKLALVLKETDQEVPEALIVSRRRVNNDMFRDRRFNDDGARDRRFNDDGARDRRFNDDGARDRRFNDDKARDRRFNDFGARGRRINVFLD